MWGGDDPTRSAECGHAVESQQVTMIMREFSLYMQELYTVRHTQMSRLQGKLFLKKTTTFVCEDHRGTTVVIRGSVPSA